MNRRSFLATTLLSGAAASTTGLLSCRTEQEDAGPGGQRSPLDRVMRAMLSMQRYSWEQGVAAQALLEWGDLELVVLFAKEAVLRQRDDGRLAVMGDDHGVTDPAASGEAVLRAAALTSDERLAAASQRMLAYLLEMAPRAEDGTLFHLDDKPQVWIDSLYMAPPFLAVAGHPEEAVAQIQGMRRRLWNPEHRLFAHMWDEARQDFARSALWGVGNGWAAAGMARVIAALPDQLRDERSRLVAWVTELLDGCLAVKRPDGLFHDVLDDSSSFVETNLAQMLASTIYRGVAAGWLPDDYLPHAEHLRTASTAKVDRFGLVQGVCGAPRFDAPGVATEGQAFHIMMRAAHRDLLAVGAAPPAQEEARE